MTFFIGREEGTSPQGAHISKHKHKRDSRKKEGPLELGYSSIKEQQRNAKGFMAKAGFEEEAADWKHRADDLGDLCAF